MNSDIFYNLGRQLRESRIARRLTQPQLAQRVGRDPARISEIERDLLNSRSGRDRLTLIGEICDALDLRIVLATPAQAEAIRLQQLGEEQSSMKPSPGSDAGSAFEDLFVDLGDDDDGSD